ncbi:unnamed protein product [Cylicostephanus goldi]|uniref:Uncharacterized protein n=1 Tax=Cylicostephanus goldi TaxID=71465 RepID=A0A3P7R0Q1_CYLGO|nr:unnamed protein product [Cylicostephanus goldi]
MEEITPASYLLIPPKLSKILPRSCPNALEFLMWFVGATCSE